MDRAVPRCASLIHSCQNAGTTACALARSFCTARILDYFPLKERNIYDIRGACAKPPLCYDFDNVEVSKGCWVRREGEGRAAWLCIVAFWSLRRLTEPYTHTRAHTPHQHLHP